LSPPPNKVRILCDCNVTYNALIYITLRLYRKVVSIIRKVISLVLGGLSQGCAAGLCVMLGLAGEAEGYLGGFIGMSGWLPWRTRLEEILRQETDEEDNDNPFGTDGDEGAEETTEMQAVNYLRDVMDLPPLSLSTFSCLFPPVFLGHGKTDEKVPFALGNEASATLKRLGMDVEWKESDIGHWYLVPDEIDDIVTFLNRIAAL
jgi:hypothetical protein